MELKINRNDWMFLLICLGLGVLAEISFFHGQIGVSYLVFIFAFYVIAFLRFQLAFNHRRIGLLFMIAIWILSANFLFYDLTFFHMVNIMIIPVLVFSHIVLMTSPSTFKWGTPKFILLLIRNLEEGMHYIVALSRKILHPLFKSMNEKTAHILKRVLVGVGVAIPLLIIITSLLISADLAFQNMMFKLPQIFTDLNITEWAFRSLFVIVAGFIFFGVFQVLQNQPSLPEHKQQKTHWSPITAITILIMINAVYLLFMMIQFKYFFNGQLIGDLTYAEYARRGFFELIVVLLINWTMLFCFLRKVAVDHKKVKVTINVLYSVLIMMSGVMLISAYQRLSLYEAAYGFTLSRILAHAFLIYLMVIFAYTFIRVWLEKISLLHFYLIVGLIFYAGLNAVNLEKVIVDQNIDRYEQTGKIDVHYLGYLSYGGVAGLIDLYKQDPEIEELADVLQKPKEMLPYEQEYSWQSFNFVRHQTMKKLEQLELQEKLDGSN